MSYSFNVLAANKAEAKEKVAAKMAEVAQNQPCHAHDQAQACAAADAFIDLLPDDAEKTLSVSVNGSLGWSGAYGDGHTFTSASFSVSAYMVARAAAA